jgi:hypothetical protein
MIRFLLRTLGLVFLAAAFVFVVYDGTRSIAANALFPPLYTPLNETWTAIHVSSLQQVQSILQRNIPPWLWDPVAVSVLNAPTFVVLGVMGAILVLLGRRKKRLIGYGR